MPVVNPKTSGVAGSTGPVAGAYNNLPSGKRSVKYRNARGGTMDATVLSAGTTSGFKIQITSDPVRRIIDNVALATARNQTNVIFHRRG